MALLDSQVAVLANQALNYLVSGHPPGRLGNAHPNIVPYQSFATADGHIIIAIGNDRQFAEFCRIAGLDGLAADPRFLTNRTRVANRQALVALVAEAIATRTTAQWIAALEPAGVPCGPINTIDQVFADEQVKARGLRIDLERPDGTVVPGVANPIRLARSPVEYSRPAPALGADTDDVLARLPRASSMASSSNCLSKWSSMAPLLRPVTNTKCSIPASRASSTVMSITGRSTTGIISFGIALVAGRNRVPSPATGNTAFLIGRTIWEPHGGKERVSRTAALQLTAG
jgi:hypothetical protein